MGRPISWPDVSELSPREQHAELRHYSVVTEAAFIATNFERAGLAMQSLSYESTMREAEGLEDSHAPALRVTELRLLVGDKPRHVSQTDADKTLAAYGKSKPLMVAENGGDCHAKPLRTKVVHCLGCDRDLERSLESMALVAVFMRDDVVASPNQSPKRRAVLHSAGRDVQRHVISESVQGELLPMRQVADPSAQSYDTIDVDRLPNRALTLSDLRLELGIVENRVRSTFAMQLQAAERCLEMVKAIENLIDSGKLVF